jgi:hypothetical protein
VIGACSSCPTPSPTPLPATATPTPTPTPSGFTVRIYAKRSSAIELPTLYYGINNQHCPDGGSEIVTTVGTLAYTLTGVTNGSIIYLAMTDNATGTGADIYNQCTQVATNTYCASYTCAVASVEITGNTDISIQARTNIAVCGTIP